MKSEIDPVEEARKILDEMSRASLLGWHERRIDSIQGKLASGEIGGRFGAYGLLEDTLFSGYGDQEIRGSARESLREAHRVLKPYMIWEPAESGPWPMGWRFDPDAVAKQAAGDSSV